MWKKGQKFVCTKQYGTWINDESKEKELGPKYNEVVTLSDIYDGYFIFSEYPDENTYNPKEFRPIEPRKDIDTLELVRKFSIPEKLDVVKVPEIETA